VHIKHATTSAVQLKSDVTVTNPYDHELPLMEITYFLRSNDKYVVFIFSLEISFLLMNISLYMSFLLILVWYLELSFIFLLEETNLTSKKRF
jgi:hypothetical protein